MVVVSIYTLDCFSDGFGPGGSERRPAADRAHRGCRNSYAVQDHAGNRHVGGNGSKNSAKCEGSVGAVTVTFADSKTAREQYVVG